MKKLVITLFIIFLIWMIVGACLLYMEYPKAQIVMGLGVFFMSFILMPIFIYYRYRDGKYKKYIIGNEKSKD
ncbi:hypothetical protein [Tenacibaculum sp. IB213877]|uniref:hypothetical protein n=1 Tax=Tenacibaculum sp. IB213877 TaxID=3097351 RepID=UPI002A5AC361|nr:hypothetical protein [Tenacibaculum sp. IB213877]MDY0780623.1 hypothetical protein [Tenacibaculum sp. IB213877]